MAPTPKTPRPRRAGSEPGLSRAEIRARMTPAAPAELTAEQEARADEAIAHAEEELTAGGKDAVRVNFRWTSAPLSLVKRAAGLADVPYQIYIKQVLYERALADLQRMADVRRTLIVTTNPPEPITYVEAKASLPENFAGIYVLSGEPMSTFHDLNVDAAIRGGGGGRFYRRWMGKKPDLARKCDFMKKFGGVTFYASKPDAHATT